MCVFCMVEISIYVCLHVRQTNASCQLHQGTRSLSLVPVNVTLFEKRVFEDTISILRWGDYPGFWRWTLNATADVHMRERKGDWHTYREGSVNLQEDTGTMKPQIKEYWQPPEAVRGKKFPKGNMILPTPWFLPGKRILDFLSSELWNNSFVGLSHVYSNFL